MEQNVEGGQQQHEERCAFLPAQTFQCGHHLTIDSKSVRGSAPAVHWWAWTICRQFEHRERTAQLLFPVSEFPAKDFTIHPFALPLGIVCIPVSYTHLRTHETP